MEDRYIRVATTLYKIVRKPLLSGDFMELRVPWNYETLRQDETKDFIAQIKKYDGFCCVPSHTNYQRTIGTFLRSCFDFIGKNCYELFFDDFFR